MNECSKSKLGCVKSKNSYILMIDVVNFKLRLINGQSASSLKVIHKSIFVLSRSAPIRSQKRPVWASSLPYSFNKIMAAVKSEFGV